MRLYRLTRKARRDAHAIASYIARENVSAALRWFDELHEHFQLLTSQSEMGERCSQFRKGARRISFGNYVIYFGTDRGMLVIYRVLHGARDPHGLV